MSYACAYVPLVLASIVKTRLYVSIVLSKLELFIHNSIDRLMVVTVNFTLIDSQLSDIE